MDPVTHAASGAIALLALKNRPATLWSLPIAAIACASPDIDLAFIHTPLEFMQLHRGITHSFAGSVPLGLILALCSWPLWRKKTQGRWNFPIVWIFCIAMIWLHIWLDIVTTYGTMVFLPFSHYRVRLNALFIVDLFITIPLLLAIWRWRTKRTLMLAAFAWIFIYPGINVIANIWHSSQWWTILSKRSGALERPVVLPDVFTPFFWRVLYIDQNGNERKVIDQPLDFFGNPRGLRSESPSAPAELTRILTEDSIAGKTYFNFAILPVIAQLRKEDEPAPPLPDSELFMFYDLRFGSGLQFVNELLAMRPNADMPFQLLAEMIPAPQGSPPDNTNLQPARIRLRFTDSGRDSQWHRPERPQPPTLWQWLLGIE